MTTLGRNAAMWSATAGLRSITIRAVALGVLAFAAPASAQWTPVAAIPAIRLFSVRAKGDTITAGADTAVYVSTNAGASWQPSARLAAGVVAVEATVMRNGRLYAGTFGQGAFVSDDLGATWSPYNDGLVGGFLDSQLDLVDLVVRGDSLYAATAGAGAYVRALVGPSTWHHFGDVFEPNQASNLNSLALGGTRLLASGGANGMVFVNDPGETDWTISNLDNVGIHPALTAQTAAWTGTGWVVGTNLGIFRSVAGEEPWTRFNPGLGPLDWTTFAAQGGHLFVALDIANGAVIEESDDNGATWQNAETFPFVFIIGLAASGNNLYAARGDGLWRRPAGTASVPADGDRRRLHFALAGPQPFRDQTRLSFELPEAGSATIEVFDVLGRIAADRIEGRWSAGPHEVSLDARRLSPGVYAARLSAAGASEVVRLVRIR